MGSREGDKSEVLLQQYLPKFRALVPWWLEKNRRAVNAEVVRSAAEQLNIIPFCLQKKKRCAAAQKKWKNFHQNKYGLVFGA